MDAEQVKGLWAADCDDVDRLLERLGLGNKAEVAQQYRSEAGFLRTTKVEAAIRERLASHWLPIETAPKDGTDILVIFDCATVPVAHIAFWRDGAELAGVGDWTAVDTGWWSYTTGSVSQEALDGYRTPTHWMPLPRFPPSAR